MKIAGIEPESIVDGEGIRYAIFVQGCPHHCDGCHNQHTWDFDGGTAVDTNEIIQDFESKELIDGITLSGGEPFEQADACLELAKAAKKRGLNVWCYTGYVLDELTDSWNKTWLELLMNIDVLIDGRFVKEKKSLDLRFRGSSNQRIICLDYGRIVSVKGDDVE